MTDFTPAPADREATARPDGIERFAYEVSIFLPVPAPRAFSAFVNDLDRWWTFRLRDRTRCIIEPHVGGRWMQEWDNGGALFGNFTVFDPPKMLVITGPLAMTQPAYNRVEFRFEPVEGGTKLWVLHQAFGEFEPDTADMYTDGWEELLGGSLFNYVTR